MTYRRIVVLGGGTAGWMTAAALATGLKGTTVELVESEDIGTVGVGEATFPSIRNYHQILGISETDFLRATNGTYKLGIRFCDWRVRGEDYYHTFGNFGQMTGPESLFGQYRRHPDAEVPVFGELCLPTVMAMQNRFCSPGQDSAAFNYAYHFDATLYARFLRDFAIKRGVRRTEGKVADVTRRADGGVAALRLDDGRTIEADLFFDCSGFASLLLGRTLGEPFVDYSHWLPVDRAWAVPCARTDTPLTPYTRATALEAGWAWRIALQDRTGNGHVFSTRYIDEEKARTQLLQQLDGEALAEPRLLKFTTGHRERFWVGNVIGIGLSTGFLEPLESTSIYLIQAGLGHMMHLLQAGGPIASTDIDTYNSILSHQFARIRDFILLHYCLTERRDTPFWTDMANKELPETLAYKLHTWRETGLLHQYDHEGFDEHSWLAIHAGMRNWPQRTDPILTEIPAELSLQWVRERGQQLAKAVSSVPTHEAYLAHMLGR